MQTRWSQSEICQKLAFHRSWIQTDSEKATAEAAEVIQRVKFLWSYSLVMHSCSGKAGENVWALCEVWRTLLPGQFREDSRGGRGSGWSNIAFWLVTHCCTAPHSQHQGYADHLWSSNVSAGWIIHHIDTNICWNVANKRKLQASTQNRTQRL